MSKQYWLLKSEPNVFSIDDLARSSKQTIAWEGVRNYQARNFMRAMHCGDLGFFYHSNARPSAIVGVVEIIKEAYPDLSALNPCSDYYDVKSSKENLRWDCVDVKLVKKFSKLISLEEIKHNPYLKKMGLLHHSRLSVQPVAKSEWDVIISSRL